MKNKKRRYTPEEVERLLKIYTPEAATECRRIEEEEDRKMLQLIKTIVNG